MRLAGKSRFANAGVRDHHHPMARRVRAGGRDRLELLVAADERPGTGKRRSVR